MSSSNINSVYFDGQYKEIWRSIIPEALTKAETEYLIQEVALVPGKSVLDLMCGYGRNAIALAEYGIHVTAVDNLDAYINEIKEVATEKKLSLEAMQADVLEYQPERTYDLVICLGNNLNFFMQAELSKLFEKISQALQPAGKFIFSTWSITEIAIKQFQEKTWNYVGEKKFLHEAKFYWNPARIEFTSHFINTDGSTEIKKGIDYLYSINELINLLSQKNLSVKEIYSIPGKKKFTIGEPRAYFVVEKL